MKKCLVKAANSSVEAIHQPKMAAESTSRKASGSSEASKRTMASTVTAEARPAWVIHASAWYVEITVAHSVGTAPPYTGGDGRPMACFWKNDSMFSVSSNTAVRCNDNSAEMGISWIGNNSLSVRLCHSTGPNFRYDPILRVSEGPTIAGGEAGGLVLVLGLRFTLDTTGLSFLDDEDICFSSPKENMLGWDRFFFGVSFLDSRILFEWPRTLKNVASAEGVALIGFLATIEAGFFGSFFLCSCIGNASESSVSK